MSGIGNVGLGIVGSVVFSMFERFKKVLILGCDSVFTGNSCFRGEPAGNETGWLVKSGVTESKFWSEIGEEGVGVGVDVFAGETMMLKGVCGEGILSSGTGGGLGVCPLLTGVS